MNVSILFWIPVHVPLRSTARNNEAGWVVFSGFPDQVRNRLAGLKRGEGGRIQNGSLKKTARDSR